MICTPSICLDLKYFTSRMKFVENVLQQEMKQHEIRDEELKKKIKSIFENVNKSQKEKLGSTLATLWVA